MLWTIEAKSEFEYGYAAGKGRERLFRKVVGLALASLAGAGCTNFTAVPPATSARRGSSPPTTASITPPWKNRNHRKPRRP